MVGHRDDSDGSRVDAINQTVRVIVQVEAPAGMFDPNAQFRVFEQTPCGLHGGVMEILRNIEAAFVTVISDGFAKLDTSLLLP